MLKYKLKKGLHEYKGISFEYKHIHELMALLRPMHKVYSEGIKIDIFIESGYVTILRLDPLEIIQTSYDVSKSMTLFIGSKDDFFDKIDDTINDNVKLKEFDYKSIGVNSLDGCGFREGLYSNDNTKDLSVLERLASLRNYLVQNKQYAISAEVRDIESHLRTPRRNSSVVSKEIICGTFKGDTINYSDAIDHSSACLKTINKNTVNRIQENLPKIKGNEGVKNFFDMLYNLKIIVVDGKFKNQTDSFENATSLDGKDILIYTRKDGSKIIIE